MMKRILAGAITALILPGADAASQECDRVPRSSRASPPALPG